MRMVARLRRLAVMIAQDAAKLAEAIARIKK
jgi:hypothetical protein